MCDANVVLGYLPSDVQLGGKMDINRDASVKAVQQVADAMGIDLMAAAEGIVKIVNESMFGALRLVSVEQGYDPRDFALVGFGGAGPCMPMRWVFSPTPGRSLCRPAPAYCVPMATPPPRCRMRPRAPT